MTAEPNSDPAGAFLALSLLQAMSAGRFPQRWADIWLNNGLADKCDADRPWLEDTGTRLQACLLLGERQARDARLAELQHRLGREIWFGPRRGAAVFFAQWIADLRARNAALAPARTETEIGVGASLAGVLKAIADPAATTLLAELLAATPTRH